MTTPFATQVLDQIRRLLELHPELAEDEVLREDMIEGATDAHEFLRLLERKRQETEYLTEAIALNVSALNERKARVGRREEVLRAAMLQVMEAADLRKVELPEATISVRNGSEKVVINDEASVPKELCLVKYIPDKARIKLLLKYGQQFNWAALVTGEPTVAIRTK